ncbi:MAG: thiamine pyrophosphate-binding protein [Chloroflexi bacterium]|nr:thiamine pyrophosphate-binding protein [Chloroflexota bacterium]
MPQMTGGQALAKQLHLEGVRVIFGLPGVQLYHALDALHDEKDIKFITTRHEQATAYMADGYARAGGGIGTALVVPGPGLQNASAAIGTAYAASSPIFVISGQIERDMIGGDRGMLHEVNDQLDTIRPVTKWAQRILDPRDVPEAVHEAFYQLKSGRPRPVEIEIPPETLAEVADVELTEPVSFQRPAAGAESIQEAVRVLAGAANPLILVGGGGNQSDAGEALIKVAERLQAPIMATAEGKGTVSDHHYLSLGTPRTRDDPFHDYMARYDVILAVGTRMASPNIMRGQKIVQIDIDEAEIGRNYPNTIGVVGDARLTLEEMHRVMSNTVPQRESRREDVDSVRKQYFGEALAAEPLESFTKAVRKAMPDDGILVAGMTQMGYYSRLHFPVYSSRSYLTSSYFGNLGFAYPVALGAKVACPDKAVVALSGDGGFMYNVQELATAAMYGINVVLVVFNDNAFGNVLRDQKTRFEGRVYGSHLKNPDFMKLAEAFGVRGVKVEDQDAERLQEAVSEAIDFDGPSLIEVPVGEMPYPY